MLLKESKLFEPDDATEGVDAVKAQLEPGRAHMEPGRLDQLVTLVDHCTAAKEIAESLGDTFLSYMLSMTIQAARGEMRPKALRSHR